MPTENVEAAHFKTLYEREIKKREDLIALFAGEHALIAALRADIKEHESTQIDTDTQFFQTVKYKVAYFETTSLPVQLPAVVYPASNTAMPDWVRYFDGPPPKKQEI